MLTLPMKFGLFEEQFFLMCKNRLNSLDVYHLSMSKGKSEYTVGFVFMNKNSCLVTDLLGVTTSILCFKLIEILETIKTGSILSMLKSY